MATERLAMHQAREILRQKLTLRRSHREVVASVGVSMGAVSGVVTRAAALGLDWEAVEALATRRSRCGCTALGSRRVRRGRCRTPRSCTWSCVVRE